jgi:hypothetical protein
VDEERKLQLELKRRQAALRHEEEIAQSAIFEEQQREAAEKVFEAERVSRATVCDQTALTVRPLQEKRQRALDAAAEVMEQMRTKEQKRKADNAYFYKEREEMMRSELRRSEWRHVDRSETLTMRVCRTTGGARP